MIAFENKNPCVCSIHSAFCVDKFTDMSDKDKDNVRLSL